LVFADRQHIAIGVNIRCLAIDGKGDCRKRNRGRAMTEDEHAFQAYSKISEQIAKEDARINERMTWGLSINGALLALFGVVGGLLKDFLPRASTSVVIFACVIATLLAIIAGLVCYWTIRGVQDARKQVYYVREFYNFKWKQKLEDKFGLPRPFGSRELNERTVRVSRWWGDSLFVLVGSLWPIIAVGCWTAAVYYRLIAPPSVPWFE
jgi:hypothetical protein